MIFLIGRFQEMIHWAQSPVIITFDSLETSIWEIPFPAVTVCNMNALNHQKVKDQNECVYVRDRDRERERERERKKERQKQRDEEIIFSLHKKHKHTLIIDIVSV